MSENSSVEFPRQDGQVLLPDQYPEGPKPFLFSLGSERLRRSPDPKKFKKFVARLKELQGITGKGEFLTVHPYKLCATVLYKAKTREGGGGHDEVEETYYTVRLSARNILNEQNLKDDIYFDIPLEAIEGMGNGGTIIRALKTAEILATELNKRVNNQSGFDTSKPPIILYFSDQNRFNSIKGTEEYNLAQPLPPKMK